jgi:hypothetical protein
MGFSALTGAKTDDNGGFSKPLPYVFAARRTVGQMGAFRVARSASDQDDQAGMVSGLTSKRQKMIAVAADEDQSLQTGVAKDLFIG